MNLYVRQFKILIYKNWQLWKKAPFSIALRVFFPALSILVLFIVLKLIPTNGIDHSNATPVMNIPKCFLPVNCTTLAYHPDNSAVNEIMQTLAEQQGLKFGQDVRSISQNATAFYDSYYQDSPVNNQTQYAVFFFVATPENFTYVLFSNYSEIMPDSVTAQVAIERAIVHTLSRKVNKEADTKISVKEFPRSHDYGGIREVVSRFVVFMILFSMSSTLLYCTNGIEKEKEAGLRGYMKIFGLKDIVFWSHAMLENFLIFFVSGMLMLVMGYSLPDMNFFHKTSFMVLFCTLLCYGFALVTFSCCCSTIVSKSLHANTLIFACYVTSLIWVILWIFLETNYYRFWSDDWIEQVGNWPKIMIIFPPFHFIKALGDVGIETLVNDQSYLWDNLSNNLEPAESTGATLLVLLINGVAYLILTWYFDNVIPDKHKATLSPFFPFFPHYWFPSLGSQKPNSQELAPLLRVADSDLNLEIDAVKNCSNEESVVLKIVGLRKKYWKWKFWESDSYAVNGLFLSAESGSVLCLLGHNGAGKTTTINTMIGLTAPTSGNIYLSGMDVSTNIDAVRERISVCPQFDTLWPELSGRDHLYIFLSMKEVADPAIEMKVSQKLHDVRLSKAADRPTSTYSGGMKRRLSVAISTIGSPSVIILDEPTTGVDPANRRYIWKMIQQIKKNRLVILTTHSMEEADALGEKIAIMANGELKAVGTSLHLKNKFGSGYRVNLIADLNQILTVKQQVARMVPGATLVMENGSSLVYSLASLDLGSAGSISEFFQFLQLQSQLPPNEAIIRDWGIHNTTLEDVFIRVTRDADALHFAHPSKK